MVITNETISQVPEKDQGLLTALLKDLNELNTATKKPLYIEYVTEHTQYSAEWTEPMPDFYGKYILHPLDKPYELIGEYGDIHDLDVTMLTLFDYTSYILDIEFS